MPASRARSIACRCSAGSPCTISPPTAPQPKPSAETDSPVLPSSRCCTRSSYVASHASQRVAVQPVRQPILLMPRPERLVEVDAGLVPIKHRPLHPPVAAPHRLGGARAKQPDACAPAACLGHHEQILKV